MDWTYFAVLAIGLAIGIVSGWQWGRASSSHSRQQLDQSASFNQANANTAAELTSSSAVKPDALSDTASDTADDQAQPSLAARLQQMQLAYFMATEMERFKAGFLARSSHELRSPINSVISLHQLILADLCEDPAEEREFIAQAQSAAEKMLSLLDRLISISKTIYGTESLQIQPLQLELVLGEVLHFTQLQARNRSLHLEIEPPDPEIYVLADPRWLRQILIYLIDTPITLMQEGYIRLKTQADWQEQRVNIWIEDQRPAAFWRDPIDWLPEGTQPLPKLLQLSEARAAHLDESNMPPSPGLNLLIVQTLLELMGGELLLLATPEEDSSALDAASNQPAHLSPSSAPNFTQIQCSLPLAPAGEATPGS